MSFILRMVGREIRSSWRRLLFFFLCIAIGVASIVSIRSVIQNVRAGLFQFTGQSDIVFEIVLRARRIEDASLQRARARTRPAVHQHRGNAVPCAGLLVVDAVTVADIEPAGIEYLGRDLWSRFCGR